METLGARWRIDAGGSIIKPQSRLDDWERKTRIGRWHLRAFGTSGWQPGIALAYHQNFFSAANDASTYPAKPGVMRRFFLSLNVVADGRIRPVQGMPATVSSISATRWRRETRQART
ncbi:hypothetical protein ACRAVF_28775 [Bradyrhizobium oligotrophicum S58]